MLAIVITTGCSFSWIGLAELDTVNVHDAAAELKLFGGKAIQHVRRE
jgi:hypothetical protein